VQHSPVVQSNNLLPGSQVGENRSANTGENIAARGILPDIINVSSQNISQKYNIGSANKQIKLLPDHGDINQQNVSKIGDEVKTPNIKNNSGPRNQQSLAVRGKKKLTFKQNNQLTNVRNYPIISKEKLSIFKSYLNEVQGININEPEYNFTIKDALNKNQQNLYIKYTFSFIDKKIGVKGKQEEAGQIYLEIKQLNQETVYDCKFLEEFNEFKFYKSKNNTEYFIGKEREVISFERRERIQVLGNYYSIITYVEPENQNISNNNSAGMSEIFSGQLAQPQKNYIFENDYQEWIKDFFNGKDQIYQSFIQPILSLNHTSYTDGFIFAEEDVESNSDKAVFIFYTKDESEIEELLKIVIDKSTQKIIVNENELIYNQSKNCWESEQYRFCEQGIFIIDQRNTYKLVWEDSTFFNWKELTKNQMNNRLKNILQVPSRSDNLQQQQQQTLANSQIQTSQKQIIQDNVLNNEKVRLSPSSSKPTNALNANPNRTKNLLNTNNSTKAVVKIKEQEKKNLELQKQSNNQKIKNAHNASRSVMSGIIKLVGEKLSTQTSSSSQGEEAANLTKNPYTLKAKNFLEKLNQNISNQTEIDSIYDAYSNWISDVRITMNKSSKNDKNVIRNIIKKYEEFKRKYPINKELLKPINFNDISNNNTKLTTNRNKFPTEIPTEVPKEPQRNVINNSNISGLKQKNLPSNSATLATVTPAVQQIIKANEAAANSKKVETPSKNLLESSINQVVLDLLKKNYGDYIKDNNGEIILYKTKNSIQKENQVLIYNYKTNKFILISQNLFFTFQDFINNSVNKKSEKYIIFKSNNNYLIIDDNHIYLLLLKEKYFVLEEEESNRIRFNPIISNNTIRTISGLVNSNSNMNDKDFLNFIGKLEHENLNKNSINQYLKNLNEKYQKLSENKKKLYEPFLIQKKKKLLELNNSATKFGSNVFIEHSVDNKNKFKKLLNKRLVPTNSENPQGGVIKYLSNIGSKIKSSIQKSNPEEQLLIKNFN
jgi:hypothetical protein